MLLPFPAGTPLLDDLAIRDPPEMEGLPLDFAAGGWIGPTPRLVRRDEIAFGNDGVDRHLHIGKDRVEIDDGLLDPGWAGGLVGESATIDELWGIQLVDERRVVRVERILKDSQDNGFIRFEGSGRRRGILGQRRSSSELFPDARARRSSGAQAYFSTRSANPHR